MVDVRSVGAGGGSIASINAAGMLRSARSSAGSEPGPICYGRGGTEPTITDANLRARPARPGAPAVGARAADRRARARDLRPSGSPSRSASTVEAAAAAVIRLANTHMAGAIRMVSLGARLDPRDFTLFAFGGAGPLHAVALARELGIPEVLVPARPGLTNALGCLVADLRQDFVNTLNVPLDGADMAEVHAILAAQRERGRRSTPRSRARSSRPSCCTAPTCSSAARRI